MKAPHEELPFARCRDCPAELGEAGVKGVSYVSCWNAAISGWNHGMFLFFSTLLGDKKTTFPIKAHQECYKPNVITKIGTVSRNPEKKRKKMQDSITEEL